MKSMLDVKDRFDEQYCRRTDHFRHCDGVDEAAEKRRVQQRCAEALRDVNNRLLWRTKMDQAWTVCLHRAEIIPTPQARRVLSALQSVLAAGKPGRGGEHVVLAQLDGDEDTASIVNLGRTLQEPMSRLKMRDRTVEVTDDLLELLTTVLDTAAANVDTIMPGHTHLSQGQPITLAHYLLSVFDGLHRGLKQFELAYADTNRNSGGCGACSGTLWPVDRRHLTRLLGFDDLVEPTYDCEASQDHSMSIMFALTNIVLLISKVAMDGNIWGMEEVDMLHNDPGWCGQSSFMPHKCNTGSQFERSRIKACETIAEMQKGLALTKGEPHGDMLPMLEVPNAALAALAHAQLAVGYLNGLLASVLPQKETMLEYVREGFSCSTEIVVHMVRELGYGGRRAHRIAATFVRMSRARGVRAFETTGEDLDEAARFVNERPPGIDTATLRRLLDPVVFIEAHCHTGGTAPKECRRMIDARRRTLATARERQAQRKARLEDSDSLLQTEIAAILSS